MVIWPGSGQGINNRHQLIHGQSTSYLCVCIWTQLPQIPSEPSVLCLIFVRLLTHTLDSRLYHLSKCTFFIFFSAGLVQETGCDRRGDLPAGHPGHCRSRGVQRHEGSVHEDRGGFPLCFCHQQHQVFWGHPPVQVCVCKSEAKKEGWGEGMQGHHKSWHWYWALWDLLLQMWPCLFTGKITDQSGWSSDTKSFVSSLLRFCVCVCICICSVCCRGLPWGLDGEGCVYVCVPALCSSWVMSCCSV